MPTRSTTPTPRPKITQLVAAWRRSDEPNAVFARRHGIHPRTFWGWCRTRPEREGARPMGDAVVPTFMPVTVTSEAAPAETLEVLFTSGDRLVVRASASPDVVRALVLALRATC